MDNLLQIANELLNLSSFDTELLRNSKDFYYGVEGEIWDSKHLNPYYMKQDRERLETCKEYVAANSRYRIPLFTKTFMNLIELFIKVRSMHIDTNFQFGGKKEIPYSKYKLYRDSKEFYYFIMFGGEFFNRKFPQDSAWKHQRCKEYLGLQMVFAAQHKQSLFTPEFMDLITTYITTHTTTENTVSPAPGPPETHEEPSTIV